LWDVEKLAFDNENAVVYDFPKNEECETVYCNVEGVHFLDHQTILTVSDKMKKKNQDLRCKEKDQSAHVFVLT